MATTNDDLLVKEAETLRAVEGVHGLILGKGGSRLATEEFITKQISELKKSAGGKTPDTSSGKEEKDEPGVVETLAQGVFGKDLTDAVKGMFGSALSLKTTTGLGLALVAAIGVNLFSLQGLIKDVLSKKNKELTTSFGLPRLKDTTSRPVQGPQDPTMLDLAMSLGTANTAAQKLDTSIDGLHSKIDHLLAELS